MPWLLNRAQLHDLVWSEPMRSVAKRFGVSDVAINKACKRFDLPRPGPGYWRRAETGKKVKRLPLPPLPFGMSEDIVIGGDGWTPWNGPAVIPWVSEPDEPREYPSDDLVELRPRALKRVGKVAIKEFRSPPHGLTLRVRPPAIRPSGPIEERRWLIIDEVIKAAERAGAKPQVPHSDIWIRFVIGRQSVSFKVEHPEDGEWPSTLRLEIAPYGSAWRDRADNLLEYHLAEIVAELFVTAGRFD